MADATSDGPTPASVQRLEIGRIGKAHGLRGEVSVTATTNRLERFQAGSVLYSGSRRLVVTSARPHQTRWLVHFEDVSDRSAAETLRGAVLTGDPLGPLPEGEVWVHELVDAFVSDRSGHELGRVVAVHANPAHDLLELESGALIPIVFVVSSEPGRVVVDPPPGLLELTDRNDRTDDAG